MELGLLVNSFISAIITGMTWILILIILIPLPFSLYYVFKWSEMWFDGVNKPGNAIREELYINATMPGVYWWVYPFMYVIKVQFTLLSILFATIYWSVLLIIFWQAIVYLLSLLKRD